MDTDAFTRLIGRLSFELRELHFNEVQRASRFDPGVMVGDSGKMSELMSHQDLPRIVEHIADTIVSEARDLRITLPPAAGERISVILDLPENDLKDDREFRMWAMSTLLNFAVREVLVIAKQYGEIIDGENDLYLVSN